MRLEPFLPPDLEREIFEIDALEHIASIPRLLRVARRVKLWIEPLLYRVILITPPGAGMALPGHETCLKSGYVVIDPQALVVIIARKSASFFHAHVRHLFIDSWDMDPVDQGIILAACTGATNVILLNLANPRPLLTGLSRMPLQQLQANLGSLFSDGTLDPAPVDFSHPIFHNITHLAVFDSLLGSASDWKGLALLPCLTHLSFEHAEGLGHLPNPLIEEALQACSLLEVLVILLGGWADEPLADHLISTFFARHARVVIMNDHKTSGGVVDWNLGARGKCDYWRRAEGVIRERRRLREGDLEYAVDRS
ncbi:hypothetical protein FB451DRAFT_1030005 [Mycena latifolia]|nr:hypothetical protein FB451DRAFT_1030005 [Mycena latifolia]